MRIIDIILNILEIMRDRVPKSIKFPFLSRLELWFYQRFRQSIFLFNGRQYYYFYHIYNQTWRNERAVEIPIIWYAIREHLKSYPNAKILEVGNVMSHYFPHYVLEYQKTSLWDIVDKYERPHEYGIKIINEDIVQFNPNKKYSLIISISTLEHVGFQEHLYGGEPIFEPGKILKAFENMVNLLDENGTMIVTIPIGENPYLDKMLAIGCLKFSEIYAMIKIGRNWWQVSFEGAIKYAIKYKGKNMKIVIIGILRKKDYKDKGTHTCNELF